MWYFVFWGSKWETRKGKPSSSSGGGGGGTYHRASTLNVFSFTDYWCPSLGHSSANVALRKTNSWLFLWLVNLFVKEWRWVTAGILDLPINLSLLGHPPSCNSSYTQEEIVVWKHSEVHSSEGQRKFRVQKHITGHSSEARKSSWFRSTRRAGKEMKEWGREGERDEVSNRRWGKKNSPFFWRKTIEGLVSFSEQLKVGFVCVGITSIGPRFCDHLQEVIYLRYL
jgi:hypothetical protein